MEAHSGNAKICLRGRGAEVHILPGAHSLAKIGYSLLVRFSVIFEYGGLIP